MKVKEFRAEWEAAMAVRGEDKDALFDLDDVDESILQGSLHTYFERTSPMIRGVEKSEVEPTTPPVGTRDDQDTLGWE
jgi:hypothetical protein